MKLYKHNRGYTIIETMIAVSVFLVVVTAGTGALLNANNLHQKSQDLRSILDSMSFIMEDMSRNLRTGYNYRCITNSDFTNLSTSLSCASGKAIAFREGITNAQWVYKIETLDGGATYNISRSTDGAATWTQFNPPEVVINSISAFSVLGAEALPGDTQQPFVTIKLAGKITFKGIDTPFSMQTSVSQRIIDI